MESVVKLARVREKYEKLDKYQKAEVENINDNCWIENLDNDDIVERIVRYIENKTINFESISLSKFEKFWHDFKKRYEK